MATVIVVGIVITGCLVVLFLRKMFRKHMAQFENIDCAGVRFHLQMLSENGYEGSFLFLDDMTSQRFIQFRKYITRSGRAGIECHFPQAPWSEPYYGGIRQLVQALGMDFEEMTVAAPPVSGFIDVDFGTNIDAACQFAEDVFTKIFGLPVLSVRLRSHGISMKPVVNQ
jgi:hypothetical protein